MKKIFLILLLILELESITLDEALSKLEKSNIEIKTSNLNAQIISLNKKILSYSRLGKLDLNFGAIRSDDPLNAFGYKVSSREATFNDFGFDEFPSSNPPKNLNFPKSQAIYKTSIDYSIPIYSGNRVTNYIKIAQNLKEISNLESKKILFQKRYELTKTFYDVKMLDDMLSDILNMYENIKVLKKNIKSLYAQGYAKKIDIKEVDAKEEFLKSLIKEIKIDKKISLEFVKFLLQCDISKLDTNLTKIEISEDDMMIDAQIQNKNTEILSNQNSINRAKYLPQIGLFSSLSSADSKIFNDFEQNLAYTVGVGIKMNIFDGLNASLTSQALKTKLIQAKLKEKLTLSNTKLQHSILLNNIKKSSIKMSSLKKELDFLEDIYENYKIRYKEHLSSINDVLIKHSEMLGKKIELRRVLNRQDIMKLQLKKLKGQI